MHREKISFLVFVTKPATSGEKIANIFEQLNTYVVHCFAISIRPTDYSFGIQSGEPICIQYTLLDVLFITLTSSARNDILQDEGKLCGVTVMFQPRLVPLGGLGEWLMSY